MALTLAEGDLLHGVPVAIQLPIPVEKPAFAVLDGNAEPASGPVVLARDGVLQLEATAVGTEYLSLGPIQNLDAKVDCAVSFPFVPLVSYDATGAPSVEGFEPPAVYLTQLLDDDALAAGQVPMVIEGIVEYDYLSLCLLYTSPSPRD